MTLQTTIGDSNLLFAELGTTPPLPPANSFKVYAKDVSGITHLVGLDSAGKVTDFHSGSFGTITPKSANYTTTMADANTCIYHPTTDDNARTFTIDSNANVPYPIGTLISFINDKNTLTVAITSDTMVLAGGTSTGSRTLAVGAVATAVKVTATRWYISGTGIT